MKISMQTIFLICIFIFSNCTILLPIEDKGVFSEELLKNEFYQTLIKQQNNESSKERLENDSTINSQTCKVDLHWNKIQKYEFLIKEAFAGDSVTNELQKQELFYDTMLFWDNYFETVPTAVEDYKINYRFSIPTKVSGELYYYFVAESEWLDSFETTTLELFVLNGLDWLSLDSDSDTATGNTCENYLAGNEEITNTMIDGDGISYFALVWEITGTGNIANNVPISLQCSLSDNYYQPDRIDKICIVKSEYVDDNSKISHELRIDSIGFGMWFSVYSPLQWEFSYISPNCDYIYDSSLKTWNFSNLVPIEYAIYFTENCTDYYSISDITTNYFEDTDFESEWELDWTEGTPGFDEIVLNSSKFHSGSSSLRLYDSDSSDDYLNYFNPVISGSFYLSFWYYIESISNSLKISIFNDTSYSTYSLDTTLNRWHHFTVKSNFCEYYTHNAVMNIYFDDGSGVVFLDSFQLFISDTNITTIGYDEVNGIEYQYQGNLRSFDGVENPSVSNHNVSFLLYSSDYTLLHSVTAITDSNGIAQYSFYESEFSFSDQNYILICVDYMTTDCSYEAESPHIYYSTNENSGTNVRDSMENHDGTFDGSVPPSWASGLYSNCLDFDYNEHFDLSTHTIADGSDWSISAWLQFNNASRPYQYWIGDYASSERFGLYLTSGHQKFIIRFTSGTYVFPDVFDFNESQWYHISLSIDYSELTATVFVDGIEYTSTSFVNSGFVIDAIGNVWSTSEYGLDGKLDDVRIYDSELSQSQIREIMYLHSVKSSITPSNISYSIELYETDNSFILSSNNDSLNYVIWLDDYFLGSFSDFEEIPKNSTIGSHNLTYFPFYDSENPFSISSYSFSYIYSISPEDFRIDIQSYSNSDPIVIQVEPNKDCNFIIYENGSNIQSGSISEYVSTSISVSKNATGGMFNLTLAFSNGTDSRTCTFWYENPILPTYEISLRYAMNTTGFSLHVDTDIFRSWISYNDGNNWTEISILAPDFSLEEIRYQNHSYQFDGVIFIRSYVPIVRINISDSFGAPVSNNNIVDLRDGDFLDLNLPLAEVQFSNPTGDSAEFQYNRYDNESIFYNESGWQTIEVGPYCQKNLFLVVDYYQFEIYSVEYVYSVVEDVKLPQKTLISNSTGYAYGSYCVSTSFEESVVGGDEITQSTNLKKYVTWAVLGFILIILAIWVVYYKLSNENNTKKRIIVSTKRTGKALTSPVETSSNVVGSGVTKAQKGMNRKLRR